MSKPHEKRGACQLGVASLEEGFLLASGGCSTGCRPLLLYPPPSGDSLLWLARADTLAMADAAAASSLPNVSVRFIMLALAVESSLQFPLGSSPCARARDAVDAAQPISMPNVSVRRNIGKLPVEADDGDAAVRVARLRALAAGLERARAAADAAASSSMPKVSVRGMRPGCSTATPASASVDPKEADPVFS
mmetsp:Transcript_55658/g.92155  ORF Transcript_55658/g.92155 Transcript_55658/m.92155 type:complete len:192 (-) Transcript_55658:159-734(-)